MTDIIWEKLKQDGVALPDLDGSPTVALGEYVPYKIVGDNLYISGQVSKAGDQMITGKLGVELNLEEGAKAAEVCAVNILTQIKMALGTLEKVEEIVKLGGFVNCTEDYYDIPQVINGASKLMYQAFGEAGRHVRFAVGCQSLPFNVAVEVEAVVRIKK